MTSMPVELTVALIGIFVSVALVTGLVTYAIIVRQSLTRRRLDDIARSSPAAGIVLERPLTTRRDPVLARWSALLPKSAADMSRLEQRLASGGYRTATAAVVYSIAGLVIPVMFALVALAWFGFTTRNGWTAAAVAGVVGYLVPRLFLDYRIAVRRRQIRNGLPDVLDLLIVCLEAGSSLDQSVIKASQELAIAYPALAEELQVLTTETRAGKPRMEAFKNLAQRTRVDDVRALVAMLAQTDRFGTSVAQALRTMADDMRTRRRQAAEEMAAKVGVKLVFPLVLCLFPALFVVILGPAIIRFSEAFQR